MIGKEIGEVKELKVKHLLNPTERNIVENTKVCQIILFTSGEIDDLHEQLIQRELKMILGSTYQRSYIQKTGDINEI